MAALADFHVLMYAINLTILDCCHASIKFKKLKDKRKFAIFRCSVPSARPHRYIGIVEKLTYYGTHLLGTNHI